MMVITQKITSLAFEIHDGKKTNNNNQIIEDYYNEEFGSFISHLGKSDYSNE